MNFYETKAGRIFFEGQLPQLIHALQDIAGALSQTAAPLKLPLEADPKFLDDLYWGRYEPAVFHRHEKTKQLDAAVMDTRSRLQQLLPTEARESYEKYQAALEERTSYLVQQSYESGYRTAVQMILAGLTNPEQGQAQAKEKP